jgi:hypothetical protein
MEKLTDRAIRALNASQLLEFMSYPQSQAYRSQIERRIARLVTLTRNPETVFRFYSYYGPGLNANGEPALFERWSKSILDQEELNRALSRTDALSIRGRKLIDLGANPQSAAQQLQEKCSPKNTDSVGQMWELLALGVPVTPEMIENACLSDWKNRFAPDFVKLATKAEYKDIPRLLQWSDEILREEHDCKIMNGVYALDPREKFLTDLSKLSWNMSPVEEGLKIHMLVSVTPDGTPTMTYLRIRENAIRRYLPPNFHRTADEISGMELVDLSEFKQQFPERVKERATEILYRERLTGQDLDDIFSILDGDLSGVYSCRDGRWNLLSFKKIARNPLFFEKWTSIPRPIEELSKFLDYIEFDSEQYYSEQFPTSNPII